MTFKSYDWEKHEEWARERDHAARSWKEALMKNARRLTEEGDDCKPFLDEHGEPEFMRDWWWYEQANICRDTADMLEEEQRFIAPILKRLKQAIEKIERQIEKLEERAVLRAYTRSAEKYGYSEYLEQMGIEPDNPESILRW